MTGVTDRVCIEGTSGVPLVGFTGSHGGSDALIVGATEADREAVTALLWPFTVRSWTPYLGEKPVRPAPDRFCAGCGEAFLTFDDRLCGSCLAADADMGWCPGCGADLRTLIAATIVRRFRRVANDVNDAWREGGYFRKVTEWQRVLSARAKAGAR
jgi:hypothetical protein